MLILNIPGIGVSLTQLPPLERRDESSLDEGHDEVSPWGLPDADRRCRRFGPVPRNFPEPQASYCFQIYMIDQVLERGPSAKETSAIYHRLTFFRDLLREMDCSGLTLGSAPLAFGSAVNALDASDLRASLSPSDVRNIFLAFEAETKPQSLCDLWTIIRQGMLTATSIKWGQGGPTHTLDFRRPDVREEARAATLAFGKTNESLARSALVACRLKRDVYAKTPDGLLGDEEEEMFIYDENGPFEEPCFTCGLLVDLRTGMIGASMDVLVCDRNRDGLLDPHPLETLEIYEIKCRAKYLFVPGERSETEQCYERLLRNRCMGSLRRFLLSIQNPCVEYIKPDDWPTTKEALLTSHEDWKVLYNPRRVRSNCFDARHLELNRAGRSSVWLFSEPDLETLEIRPLTWYNGKLSLDVPLFANPRHPNFKQIFVQAYVLSSYYDATRIAPHLVTFIGRYRRPDEIGRRFTIVPPETPKRPEQADAYNIADGLFDPHFNSRQIVTTDHTIPVLLIITPISIDPSLFCLLEQTGRKAFSAAIDSLWDSVARPSPNRSTVADGTSS
ncbi:deoxyribonuclease [Columbid alphaherpesvirus 1]|uniref:Deoxyribonuclease n=1 Tax=Columbid alphaherpesvirus 1 TaxID=93386 RepID=A0A1V0M8E9_9ALPH|nr:deoxyribonuclease [Columbid alphaherpesvirus 1]ARD71336.1 deoxyribonuclease [Columbid alphaherpesvirus 1]